MYKYTCIYNFTSIEKTTLKDQYTDVNPMLSLALTLFCRVIRKSTSCLNTK